MILIGELGGILLKLAFSINVDLCNNRVPHLSQNQRIVGTSADQRRNGVCSVSVRENDIISSQRKP